MSNECGLTNKQTKSLREIKNVFDRFTSTQGMVENQISELQGITIETSKIKKQKVKFREQANVVDQEL